MRKNPTASIRSGFTYQDLWLAKLGAQWLKSPHEWHSIQQETYPVEVDKGRGFSFDDIVITEVTGQYRLYQIKHRQDPQNLWTWEDFLTTDSRSRRSLFKKWSESLLKSSLSGKIAFSAFITNGLADQAVVQYLKDERIDIEAIKVKEPELYQQICQEVGGGEAGLTFFGALKFKFAQMGLDELKKNLREEYSRDLRATLYGFNSLLLKIIHNGIQRDSPPITLFDLQSWCQWDEPKPLNQNFLVPKDFVLFEEQAHTALKKDVQRPIGGIKVIYGKPGVGKSTYLSNLAEELGQDKIPSIRHHYHIATNDPEANERLDVQRLTEALKYQFKELSAEVLGDLAGKNSENVAISEFIDKVASYYRKQGKSFIFILDGIDHAQVYGDREELKGFLRDVIRPQTGIWFVLGMQYIAKSCLPPLLFEKCPESTWLEIKGLSKVGVRAIVDRNRIGLKLPTKKNGFRDDVVEELFKCSQGLPLYLRYALAWLKDHLGKKQVSIFDIQNLPAYDGDITNYYYTRWTTLLEPAKWAIIALSVLKSPLTQRQLQKILSHLAEHSQHVQEAMVSIMHLLSINPVLGGISIFHNSFALFIQESEEYNLQRVFIARKILEWLHQSQENDLRWAEEKRLEYLNGNTGPILTLDRNWLVQSILDNRPAKAIIHQLDLAAEAAFKQSQFDKVLEVSTLNSYFYNIQDYQSEHYELLWEQILRKSPVTIPTNLDLHLLPPRALYSYARRFQSHLPPEFLQSVIDVFRQRYEEKDANHWNRYGDSSRDTEDYLVKVFSIDRKRDIKRTYKYILQFRPNGSGRLIGIYVSELIQTRQFGKLKEFLRFSFTDQETEQIIWALTNSSTDEAAPIFELLPNFFNKGGSMADIFRHVLTNEEIKSHLLLPPAGQFIEELKSSDIDLRTQVTSAFVQTFLSSIGLLLQNQHATIDAWEQALPNHWSANAAREISTAAKLIALSLLRKERIGYSAFFETFEKLEMLHFIEHRSYFELTACLRETIEYGFNFLIHINRLSKQDHRIRPLELEIIQKCRFWGKHYLLEFIAYNKSKLLTEEAYTVLISKQLDGIATWITEFHERSKKYGVLAKIANMHGDEEHYQCCIRQAVENALGYGGHKDMFLHQVMDSVENCHEHSSIHVQSWIARLAPLILQVKEYTDGDETSGFPDNFAALVAKIDPKILYNAYLHYMDEEAYSFANTIWEEILHSFDYTHNYQTELAATAIEGNAYERVKEQSKQLAGAQTALDQIHTHFGQLAAYPERKFESNYTPDPLKKDVTTIPLRKISGVIKDLPFSYEREKLFTAWFKYWAQQPCDRSDLFETVKSILNTYEWHSFGCELFEAFYPLAYEYDLETAYQCLVWIQATDANWSPYWASNSISHWTVLKRDFPDKIMNFLTDSVLKSGTRYGRSGGYFVSIPKMVKFFNYVGEEAVAEAITGKAVSIAELLMADLKLPSTAWLYREAADELDLLLARQIHPSPLVRERATVALAQIIAQDAKDYKRYKTTIEQEKLPTILLIRLLPLLKAMEDPNHHIPHFDFFELINALPYTTIVIEKALFELSLRYSGDQIHMSKRWPLIAFTKDAQPEARFERNAHQLNLTYELHVFKELEKRTSFPTLLMWSFYTRAMLEGTGVLLNVGSLENFRNNYYDEWLVGASSLSSELLRSSWLWALEYLFACGIISEFQWLKYSWQTFPVSLTLWRIHPNPIPNWWQALSSKVPEFLNNTPVFLTMATLEEKLFLSNGFHLLAFSGNVCLSIGNAYEERHSLHISVLPFAYHDDGIPFPDLGNIYAELSKVRLLTMPGDAFYLFEGEQLPETEWQTPKTIGNIRILPLIAFQDQWESGLFHWFRRDDGIMGPCHHLIGEMPVNIERSRVIYGDTGSPTITWQDWVDGIRHEANIDFGTRHGQWMEIAPSILDSFLKKEKMKIGYVVYQKFCWKEIHKRELRTAELYNLLVIN